MSRVYKKTTDNHHMSWYHLLDIPHGHGICWFLYIGAPKQELCLLVLFIIHQRESFVNIHFSRFLLNIHSLILFLYRLPYPFCSSDTKFSAGLQQPSNRQSHVLSCFASCIRLEIFAFSNYIYALFSVFMNAILLIQISWRHCIRCTRCITDFPRSERTWKILFIVI